MSIRSLAMLVFTLVSGVALTVDHYLAGEREVRAETRVQRAEHLPRMLSDTAPAPRRATRRSSGGETGGSAAPSSRAAAAAWVTPVADETSSTAFEPR